MNFDLVSLSADTSAPGARPSYLVVVARSLVRHVKNPQRAGSLHAAPRAVTCREVVRVEGSEVRGQR